MLNKNNYFLILIFFLYELKNYLNILFKKIDALKHYKLNNLIKFFKDRSVNPSNNIFFKKFTKLNKKKWPTNLQNNKNILVTSFVHLPHDAICNSLIGKYLEEKQKRKLIGLIDKNDFQAEIIMRSFGIKNFIYLDQGNIFQRIDCFMEAIKIINKLNFNFDKFLNFKYKGIHLGKAVYEHHLRYSGKPTEQNFTFKIYLFLSKSIFTYKFMNKILDKKQNISSVIQAENQFIPSNILFQVALKNKFKIYARDGAPKKVTIREFKNYLEIFTGRGEPSLNFFKFIEKNYYKKAVKEGSKIVKDRFVGKKDKAFLRESNLTFSSKTHYSKSAICNKYKWEKKKKIVFIFSHTFIDGNFVLGWRLFKDNYTWLEETLKHIRNNKKVNWLIKPHPMDYHYKKVLKFDTTDLINKFTKKYNHIKICPSDMSMTTIKNLATSIVTSHGTAALEFGSFRVPVIMAARSQFSKPVFNFRHDKSKKNYFFKLDNIDRLKKLSIIISNKAKIFLYILNKLQKIDNPLFFDKVISRDYDKNLFWKETYNLLKKYKNNKDEFKRLFFFQLDKNLRHTVDLKKINKIK